MRRHAVAANQINKDGPWQTDPEDMYYSNCLRRVARRYFADLFLGLDLEEAAPTITVERPDELAKEQRQLLLSFVDAAWDILTPLDLADDGLKRVMFELGYDINNMDFDEELAQGYLDQIRVYVEEHTG
jgi:hypothetical protein